MINSDPQMARFIAENDLPDDELVDILNLSSKFRMKREIASMAKMAAKECLLKIKAWTADMPKLAAITQFFHPEYIDSELTADEYQSLIDITKNNSKKSSFLSNPVLVIPKNMLCAMISQDFSKLFNKGVNTEIGDLVTKAILKLDAKNDAKNNDDDEMFTKQFGFMPKAPAQIIDMPLLSPGSPKIDEQIWEIESQTDNLKRSSSEVSDIPHKKPRISDNSELGSPSESCYNTLSPLRFGDDDDGINFTNYLNQI
jgi:hypothetical protein